MATATRKGGPDTPVLNAVWITLAVAGAFGILLWRGRMSWPPTELLASSFTIAGCLALVGPIVMARRDTSETGVGELLWMTGGLLIWFTNLIALVRGEYANHAWVTPLGATTMGVTTLAVVVAALRLQPGGGRNWTWTNVLGWLLGVYWVVMAVLALLPARGTLVALR
jgi:hypothetical protein